MRRRIYEPEPAREPTIADSLRGYSIEALQAAAAGLRAKHSEKSAAGADPDELQTIMHAAQHIEAALQARGAQVR